MVQIKELVANVDNYLAALCYTYHVDERELLLAVARHSNAQANRLAGFDPDRNK